MKFFMEYQTINGDFGISKIRKLKLDISPMTMQKNGGRPYDNKRAILKSKYSTK